MKRNIVINSSNTALVISDDLSGAVNRVAADSSITEEIYAFDTQLHICYAIAVDEKGLRVVEQEIPLLSFRSFAKHISENPSEIYRSIIMRIIKQ